MEKESPFSQENLNKIFKLSPTEEDRITSRENSWLEFKESFGSQSMPMYIKNCAAFANNKGGYIVFGIADRPNRLVGLSSKALAAFNNIDAQKITSHLNNFFSPQIKWEMMVHELNEKSFGLLYIYKSKNKPVICIRNSKTVKEGDIYFRYRGRTERIKYAELREIIELNRLKEQELWMKFLKMIANIGVENVGIFNLSTGDVTGPAGTYLIEEPLLSQLSFIKEGEFSETKGKPAIKIIGEAYPAKNISGISNKSKVVKTRGIRTSDIIINFLKQDNVQSPLEYIQQICFERSAFLPIYYFIYKAEISKKETINILNKVISRSRTKYKLIERLESNTDQFLPLPSSPNDSSRKKSRYIDKILKEKIPDNIKENDLKLYFQAIRAIDKDKIKSNSQYIRSFLRKNFNKYYNSADSGFADNLRRAIAWVDEALYSSSIQQ